MDPDRLVRYTEIEKLVAQIDALQKRVDVLEAAEEARRLQAEIEYESRLEHGGEEDTGV